MKNTEETLDNVRKAIHDGADFNIAYMTMNCLAAVIACYGLLANSPAVVIGAMIVAMLLGPIAGFALGLTDEDGKLLGKSALTLIGGIAGVFLTALVIGFLHRESEITNEIIARTSPNLFDLMIALAGGAAGAYSIISPRLSVAFVGVAIATALVPPLSSSAILLARGQYKLSFGAFLLAFTNIIAIQFACSLLMWLNGYRKKRAQKDSAFGFFKSQAVTLLILAVLAVFLTGNLVRFVQKKNFESNTKKIIEANLNKAATYLTDVNYDDSFADKTVVRAVVRSPLNFTKEDVAYIESKLPRLHAEKPLELRLRIVSTQVMTKDGNAFQTEEGTAEKVPQIP